MTGQELQAALDASGFGDVPADTIVTNYPIRIPDRSCLRGLSRSRSILQASYSSGPVAYCLPPTAPVAGDTNGFIVGLPARIGLHRSAQSSFPPKSDGSIVRRMKFRYDGGSGYFWGFWGDYTSQTRPVSLAALYCDGSRIRLYNNFNPDSPYYGWRAIAEATLPFNDGLFHQIEVTLRPDSGSLTLDGQSFDLTGTIASPPVRWFDKEWLGFYGILDAGTLQGRVKDFQADHLFGTAIAALTDSTDGIFFPIVGDNAGFLVAEPDVDLFGYGRVEVSNLTIKGQPGDGWGLWVNNTQDSVFEKIETDINLRLGAVFQKNCYANHIGPCWWRACHIGLQASVNAAQSSFVNQNIQSTGPCGLWIDNCWAVTIEGGWVIATTAPIVVNKSLATIKGLTFYDEADLGINPVALLRDSYVTCLGVNLEHSRNTPGPVVQVNGSGRHVCIGGRLVGKPGGPALFAIEGSAHVYLLGVAFGANSPRLAPKEAMANSLVTVIG